MFKKKKKYFLVYSYVNGPITGTSTIYVETNKKMNRTDVIEEVRKLLKEHNNVENLIILNWIRIKR